MLQHDGVMLKNTILVVALLALGLIALESRTTPAAAQQAPALQRWENGYAIFDNVGNGERGRFICSDGDFLGEELFKRANYKRNSVITGFTNHYNAIGSMGWELVSVDTHPQAREAAEETAIFKRLMR